MTKEELKKHINVIIEKTFETLEMVYNNREYKGPDEPKGFTKGGSRLVFPSYYKEGKATETRISEQELRFAFVEAFNKYCDAANGPNLFYSIETPTKRKYTNFSNDKKPHEDENGRSAEFDLVIFNENGERKCLIEFKANNADEHDHWKDFVKLNNSNEGGEDVLRYFVEIIKSYTEEGKKSTIKSLQGKLEHNEGNLKAYFFCYALEGKSTRGNKNLSGDKNISNRFQ